MDAKVFTKDTKEDKNGTRTKTYTTEGTEDHGGKKASPQRTRRSSRRTQRKNRTQPQQKLDHRGSQNETGTIRFG